MWAAIGALAGPVIQAGTELIGQVFQSKKDKLQAKSEALKKAAESENATSLAIVNKSIKDEIFMIVFVAPIAYDLLILPTMAMLGYETEKGYAAIDRSLKALENLPDWYWGLVALMVFKSFGVPVFSIIGRAANLIFTRAK